MKMVQQKVAWNKERTSSVVLSKLKEFTIGKSTHQSLSEPYWTVKGWYNSENAFTFGEFKTEEEAQKFLEQIHNMF
jgi:hypothetical protein